MLNCCYRQDGNKQQILIIKLNNMTIKEKITEAFDYLREDLSYVAMIGIIEYGDIDPNKFTKEEVEEQSFDHNYNWSEIYDEDCGRGEFLIPFYDDVYMWFEYYS